MLKNSKNKPAYSKKQKEDLIKLLANIIQAKADLCSYVRGSGLDCANCPLNELGKCAELELPEFNFEERKWIILE